MPEIDGVGIDFAADPAWAAANCSLMQPSRETFDPILLLAGGDELEKRAREIVDALSGGPHIFNLGHGFCRLRQRNMWTG